MSTPLTITTTFEHPAMDYAFLRREGMRLLEQYGGHWTDFNAHDPGITILEQVCYALTDLGYRINYDIKDLLASGEEHPYHSIFSPAEILTINPVTLADLRKIVIDVPGVKNAWIEQVDKLEPALLYDPSDESIYLETSTAQPTQRESLGLRGIYRVLIETDIASKLDAVGILQKVNDRLQACRTLSEDFLYPKILAGQGILVNARIEIGAVEDPEQLLAKLHFALAEFISPHIHFRTLAEMLNLGKRMDEIMNGPVLQHGFIEADDLEKLGRKISIRTSDLLQEIMNVEGVVAVNKISIASSDKPTETEDWYLKVEDDHAPYFDSEKSLPTIHLIRGGVEVHPSLERVGDLIAGLQTVAHGNVLSESQRDFRVPLGRDHKINQYYSIQHQFPAAYGIGALGLPESASPERKAQAKQLKAYLMFFDQLLTNTFAQLANTNKLFAFNSQETRTYFSQMIEDASLRLDEIRVNDIGAHTAKLQSITEDSKFAPARRNRFLNHLLARFAEQFTDYSLLQYGDLDETDLISDKCAFLQDYKEIGAFRGTGFNYSQPSRDTSNISGLEKRISRKLGVANIGKSNLTDLQPDSKGGFYMVEHILLRPRATDGEQFKQGNASTNWLAGALLAESDRKDPYSHQISFIFPDWLTRFKEAGFKNFIEQTLREETPAHIRVYVHWLDTAKMLAFEAAQSDWLENVIAGRMWNPPNVNPANDPDWLVRIKFRDARDRMVQALGIGLPYPLRDLKLKYPDTIAFDQTTDIEIVGGQIGVLYQLCDEDGNPIPPDVSGIRFEVQPEADEVDKGVFLATPKIQRDITFTILAVREGGDSNIRLEVYLNQIVSIKSGIDTSLHVAFKADENQIATDNQIITNYDSKVTVQIENSQEGISYKLVTFMGDQRNDLSAPQKGNRDVIALVSTVNFQEDTPVNILAYRTANWHVSDILKTNLFVKVRPDTSVAINLQPTIVDYRAQAILSLTDPQATAGYRLYKRQLTLAEYVSVSAGNIQVHTDEGRDVFIQAPEKITDWISANGFVLVGEFKESTGALSAGTGTGGLLEDTLFVVRATKLNGESLQLDQAVVVLVRPDTTPIVGVLNSVVPTGKTGMITVNNTQKGVAYQLRLDANGELVNPPGYSFSDRGINTTRLEVDFVVEGQGKPVLLLPTGNITKTTIFNVLAIKTITGVSAELSGKANLGVS